MPFYDYQCKDCSELTEIQHRMTESPIVLCQFCGSAQTEKIISSINVNVKTGNTLLKEKAKTKQITRNEMKQELRQDYGVHEVRPTIKGMTYEKVYKEIKDSPQNVKDVMKAKREASADEAKKKQKQEKEAFAKIRRKRIEEVRERRAKDDFEKRKISPIADSKKETK